MATKTERALEIYTNLKNAGGENIRKEFIQLCKSELQMTDAGAATYYNNTKKKYENSGAAPQQTTKTSTDSKPAQKPKGGAPINDDPWSIVQVKDGKILDTLVYIGKTSAYDAHDRLTEKHRETSYVAQGTFNVGDDFTPPEDAEASEESAE